MGLPVKNMKGNEPSNAEPVKLPADRPHDATFVPRIADLDHGISQEEIAKVEAFQRNAERGAENGAWPTKEEQKEFEDSLTLKERPWPKREDPKLPFKKKG